MKSIDKKKFIPTFTLQAKYTLIRMWKNEKPQVHFYYQSPLVATSFLKLMVEARFPLGDGSCESKLGKIYQGSYGWIARQIPKP